jgi:RNA polymerase sigma-70 factor (ECF subfamily)
VKGDKYLANTEECLIEQARARHADAFSDLVRMHSRRIYGVSMKMLKNHEDAEDNLQSVFCKAYDNIDRFKGHSRFSTWLVRIAINEALMKMRKVQAERSNRHIDMSKPEREDVAVLEIEDGRPNPERQYSAKELVIRALGGLPPLLRDAFLLHKAEGWISRELADAMGIAANSVKSRLFARASACVIN